MVQGAVDDDRLQFWQFLVTIALLSHHPDIRRVLANAVEWAAPEAGHGRAPDAVESPGGWFER